ncbi:MAG: hypothetical protein KDH97_19265 [Calditrichaeota bacterium]|nr:hypothetical protein [Calditrichota bacterium]
MNSSASKLLHKYAAYSDTDVRKLKKWWKTLNWMEKTAERKRMEVEMGLSSEEAVAEAAAESNAGE